MCSLHSTRGGRGEGGNRVDERKGARLGATQTRENGKRGGGRGIRLTTVAWEGGEAEAEPTHQRQPQWSELEEHCCEERWYCHRPALKGLHKQR